MTEAEVDDMANERMKVNLASLEEWHVRKK